MNAPKLAPEAAAADALDIELEELKLVGAAEGIALELELKFDDEEGDEDTTLLLAADLVFGLYRVTS